MCVEVARYPPDMRGVDRVEAVRARFAGGLQIVEPLDLILGGEGERPAVVGDGEPHAAGKGPLENR